MRQLWPLLILAGVVFFWNKSCELPPQLVQMLHPSHATPTASPFPVAFEAPPPPPPPRPPVSEPDHAFAPAANLSAGGMIDSARQGLGGRD